MLQKLDGIALANHCINRKFRGFAGSSLHNRQSLYEFSYLSLCRRTTVRTHELLEDTSIGYCMETKPTQLRILIMRREDWWVAQCLEFDLAAQARGTFDNIKAEFCRMLRVRLAAYKLEEIDPFKL